MCGIPAPDNPGDYDPGTTPEYSHFNLTWWMIVLICVLGVGMLALLFVLVRICIRKCGGSEEERIQ